MAEEDRIVYLQEFKDKVAIEAADMISIILRIENIGPIILCILSGPISDRQCQCSPLSLVESFMILHADSSSLLP